MIYEDQLITIAYPEQGTVNGHLVIAPQNETKTVDELDEDTMTQLSVAASYAATVLFETLGAQGTNIILNEDPVRYDVIARTPDDGWEHQWTPKTVDQGAMNDAMEKISFNTPLEETPPPVKEEAPPAPEVRESSPEKSLEDLEEEENQMIRQLTRIP